MIIVRVKHVREAKMCMAGSRLFFKEELPDIPWSQFVTEGVAVERLEATGHPLVLQVCALAREEAARDGQQ